MNRDADSSRAPNALEAYDPLLAGLTRAVHLAKRAGADEVREWVGLAALDAIDLGELLGMLHDVDAPRRNEIRSVIDDLERS